MALLEALITADKVSVLWPEEAFCTGSVYMFDNQKLTFAT